ncbi:carcinine transporter-like [Anticarsia gemmatalis]|uniref:carcinine transporter-like n=1 Tax=Anticarsia gemmatalis TaxID=129554 RepID=UPI003F774720
MTADKAVREIEIKLDKTKDKVEYDDLLSSAGELGLYQWIVFISSFPFYAFGVFVYLSQMFITEVSPNHWCRIPGLENFTDLQRRDLGVPKDNSVFGYSQCEMYDVNWTEVLTTGQQPDKNWKIIPCQYGWEFNKSEIPYPTIGSDFEWVCGKSSYQATAQAIFFVGSITGGFLFGWIADRFGRLPATIISCVFAAVGGTASSFARNLIEFSAARFIMGMACDTCMVMPYLLILEYIAPRYRTLIANLSFAVFYSATATALPWIALACGHWKTICLATSVPMILGVLAKFFLPESPMWLLSKGRIDEAVGKVLVIGRINKKEVPPGMIQQFKSTMANVKEEQNHSALEIFKRPAVRRMFILACLEYMCCTVAFDGLIRSIGQLEYDFFVSFTLMAITEFPSVLLIALFMDYTGRRWLCIVCLAISSVFCVLAAFASGTNTVIFAVVARFGINVGYSAITQWAPEVLPTSVRGSGVAIVHISGYVASFLSPYIVYLKEYIFWLPLVVVGCINMFGVLIAFLLPETTLNGMPQTFEDAEVLARNRGLWKLPFLETRKEKKKLKGESNQAFRLDT